MDLKELSEKIIGILHEEKRSRLTVFYGWIEGYLEKNNQRRLKKVTNSLKIMPIDFLSSGHEYGLHKEFEYLYNSSPEDLKNIRKNFQKTNRRLMLITLSYAARIEQGEDPTIEMYNKIKEEFDVVFSELGSQAITILTKEKDLKKEDRK